MPRIQKIKRITGRKPPGTKAHKICKNISKKPSDVLVKWILRGSRILDGKIYKRMPGDEDVVSKYEAKKLKAVKLVEIVGDVDVIMPDRTIPHSAVIVIVKKECKKKTTKKRGRKSK